MIGDVPLLEVKLVEERLAIEEVIEGLCAHLKQARTTSQEASSQPGGYPACERCSVVCAQPMVDETKTFSLCQQKEQTSF